jgi:hypothetical protein
VHLARFANYPAVLQYPQESGRHTIVDFERGDAAAAAKAGKSREPLAQAAVIKMPV